MSKKEQTDILMPWEYEEEEDIAEEDTKAVEISIGDDAVKELILKQDDPLSIQDKLRALFFYEEKQDDPFPINARELHDFLGIGKIFGAWIKDMIDKYDCVEDQDYKTCFPNLESGSNGGQNKIDYYLTIDTAKEFAIVQNSDLGKLIRRYLIWEGKQLHHHVEEVDIKVSGTSNTKQDHISPFDRIRHEDEQGEYWEARELQTLLGYDKWQNFKKIIDKTIDSFRAVCMTSSDWLTEINKPIISGKGRSQQIQDYRLTRRACYTIAVNCDPSKEEVAAAKQYFVIRTRQAEVIQEQIQQQPVSTLEKFKLILAIEEEHDQRLKALEASKEDHEQRFEEIRNSTQEISERTANLEISTGLVVPDLPNPTRNKRLSGMIYTICEGDHYRMSELRDNLILYLETHFGISLTSELSLWQIQLRAHYGSLKGRGITPPQNVPRPSKIKELSWLQLVAAKPSWYQVSISWLDGRND